MSGPGVPSEWGAQHNLTNVAPQKENHGCRCGLTHNLAEKCEYFDPSAIAYTQFAFSPASDPPVKERRPVQTPVATGHSRDCVIRNFRPLGVSPDDNVPALSTPESVEGAVLFWASRGLKILARKAAGMKPSRPVRPNPRGRSPTPGEASLPERRDSKTSSAQHSQTSPGAHQQKKNLSTPKAPEW
ncbi:hypothetical protein VTP21DRAFT_9684 [Calcarisporiella thermophila]